MCMMRVHVNTCLDRRSLELKKTKVLISQPNSTKHSRIEKVNVQVLQEQAWKIVPDAEAVHEQHLVGLTNGQASVPPMSANATRKHPRKLHPRSLVKPEAETTAAARPCFTLPHFDRNQNA